MPEPAWTLIKPTDTWLLWSVIVCGVALSIWLEQTYTWAAKLSGPVIALCIAMLLANVRIMPPESGVYDIVQGDLVPLALPLLLFRANVMHILRTTGWLFVCYHFAAAGTVAGAIAAALVLNGQMPDPANSAALMTASYIGGGVNFIAVQTSTKVSSEVANPLLVADNFVMAGVFIALLLICGSKWARRWFRHPHSLDAVDSKQLAAEHWKRKEIALKDIAMALAVAVTVVAVAALTADGVRSLLSNAGWGESAWVEVLANKFVHITFWSTFVATLGHRWLARIHGADEIGAYLLFVFLFVIGLPANLYTVLTTVPVMFLFCLIIAVTNIVFTFALGKLFNMELEHLALSVNASLGGPSSAAAMAISMGWSRLVLPALLIGIWGYTIGTAVGLAVGEFVAARL